MIELIVELAVIGLIGFIGPGPIFPMILDLSRKYSISYPLAFLGGMYFVDLSVMIPSFFIGNVFKDFLTPKVLGYLSLSGGFFIGYLAYGALKSTDHKNKSDEVESLPSLFLKGLFLSALSGPYWLWWTTVGFAYISKFLAFEELAFSVFSAAIFIPPTVVIFLIYKVIERFKKGQLRNPFIKYIVGIMYLVFSLKLIIEGAQGVIKS